ncbi:MAG TPA: tRNA-dihydrouridine synthase family protein [Anaerolineae bacterium]|nr:tRNA-dihydrouridine synthase family protein [Anaerolineae bacterium]
MQSELVLAPMDGICDMAFRRLCRRFGSGMSIIPFLHARELMASDLEMNPSLQFTPDERPIILQLYDNCEENIILAANNLQKIQPDAIDINMGCSIRSISARGAGAGMLRDPQKIASIIRRLSSMLDIPITAKIRIGWDSKNLNSLEIARTIEENGGALIAVHGRTRQQRLSGLADWDSIAAIKQEVGIPVIGNGDVRSIADIQRMKSHTGCDAIMIGRASIGNPWIFEPRTRASVPQSEVGEVIGEHLENMLLLYEPLKAISRFRKHLVRYVEPHALSDDLRLRLLTSDHLVSLLELLAQAGFAIPNRQKLMNCVS